MSEKNTIRQRISALFGKISASNRAEKKPLQIRRYAAAANNSYTADWVKTHNSINTELRSDLNALRARGRELLQNNDFACKFKAMCEDNIVGPNGIRLQSRVENAPGEPDKLANKAIEGAWQDWGFACDITGSMSFDDFSRNLVGSLPSDGEFLVVMVKGKAAGNKYNFALQAVDVDRIDTDFDGTYRGNLVIMGVEVNEYRRPIAIHIFTAHPSDGARSSRVRTRIPIENVIHRFKVERAEQMRGVPWMAQGMLSLHHLGNFGLSALLAAEHGANHYGFFEQDADAVGVPTGEKTQDGNIEVSSVPGVFDTLPEGYTHKAFDSKYPNEVFGPFVKTTLQRLASGWRVSYHSLANDLESVNFSSIRSGTLEERDRWRVDQTWFINVFCRRVYLEWLDMALISGQILMPNGSPLPASKREKFQRHEWQPRTWEWVDPKNDIEAKILAVNAGLMPPQDLAAAQGYDFEDNLTRIAEAQAMAKKFGVSLPAYDSKPGANSAQSTDKPEKTSKEKSKEDGEKN